MFNFSNFFPVFYRNKIFQVHQNYHFFLVSKKLHPEKKQKFQNKTKKIELIQMFTTSSTNVKVYGNKSLLRGTKLTVLNCRLITDFSCFDN